MMTVLVSLKEERKAGALSGGSVRGIVGLEGVVLVYDPPGLRKMMEMWQ